MDNQSFDMMEQQIHQAATELLNVKLSEEQLVRLGKAVDGLHDVLGIHVLRHALDRLGARYEKDGYEGAGASVEAQRG